MSEVKELSKLQFPNSTGVDKYVWTRYCDPPHASVWEFIQEIIELNEKPEKTINGIRWVYENEEFLPGNDFCDIDYMRIIKNWNHWVVEYQFIYHNRPTLRGWRVNFYWCLAGHYAGCGISRKQCPKCKLIIEKSLGILSKKDDSLFALFPLELICNVISQV